MFGNGNKQAAFLIIFIFSAVWIFADIKPVSIEAASALEKENKIDQAMAVYEEWMKGHTDDSRFPVVLLHCGELKKNPYAVIELYKNNLEFIKDPSAKRAAAKKLAQLYSLLGNCQSALIFFREAYVELDPASVNDPLLTAVPFLFLAKGEIDEAYRWVVKVNPVVREPRLRAELNAALLEIYLSGNDLPHAEAAFTIIKTEFKSFDARQRALFSFFLYYFSHGDQEKAKSYFNILQEDFSSSPEYQAANTMMGGKISTPVSVLSTPYDILGTIMLSPDSIRPAPAQVDLRKSEEKKDGTRESPKEKSSADVRIQVGSYTMRENAEYMAKDLERYKYDVEIVEATINTKIYFRVLVGKSLSEDGAQALLAGLRDHGIGGYLFNVEQ